MISIRVLAYLNQETIRGMTYPEGCEWTFDPSLEKLEGEREEYDVCLVGHPLTDRECDLLMSRVRAYSLFFLSDLTMTEKMQHLLQCRVGTMLSSEDLENFLEEDLKDYFHKPYGQKVFLSSLEISPFFQGRIHWEGMTECQLEGDFGDDLQQLAFWRMNMPLYSDQPLEIWFEYDRSESAEIVLEVELYAGDEEASLLDQWTLSEEDLKSPYVLESMNSGYLFFHLKARGKGRISIISLHIRFSRHKKGLFLPGGQRFVTKGKEEFFYYFDPGDCKPPLSVYFSGYRTQEGFEGYYMLRKLGCPFLLISDPRLEGGAFYLGDQEYEEGILSVIDHYLDFLGFDPKNLILSGMSMGTFGALYYGTYLRPAYIILAKPLENLGSIAQAERLERPGGFPTSLDVQWKRMHSLSRKDSDEMDQSFWKRFSSADWSKTTFSVAYKIEDDYDRSGYQDLLLHLRSNGVRLIGQGRHGRHNDNSGESISFFLRQYRMIMRKRYGRKGLDLS